MRNHFSTNLGLHFYTFIPPMIDHLSYKTPFCGPVVLNHRFYCIPNCFGTFPIDNIMFIDIWLRNTKLNRFNSPTDIKLLKLILFVHVHNL